MRKVLGYCVSRSPLQEVITRGISAANRAKVASRPSFPRHCQPRAVRTMNKGVQIDG
jgi:hypothetical protein